MTKHGIVMGFKESNVVQTMENKPPMTGNDLVIKPSLTMVIKHYLLMVD
jgi:hypothetical protein